MQISFHICKWRIFLFKNHLHSGLTEIIPKTIRIWSKWAKEYLNVTSTREPTGISQMHIKKLFCIFKPIISFRPNTLHSGRVKLGPRMTRMWEKKGPRTTRLHSQLRPCVQLSNGYPNIISYFQMKNLFFKNHLHSGLTKINPKMIRIWSKWAKECLNVTSAREPTCISQMGIKKLFYIFKPIIPLFLNCLHSGLVKLGPRMTRSWEKGAQELHVFARN